MPSARSNFTSKQANLLRDTSAYVFWAARRLVLQISACLLRSNLQSADFNKHCLLLKFCSSSENICAENFRWYEGEPKFSCWRSRAPHPFERERKICLLVKPIFFRIRQIWRNFNRSCRAWGALLAWSDRAACWFKQRILSRASGRLRAGRWSARGARI